MWKKHFIGEERTKCGRIILDTGPCSANWHARQEKIFSKKGFTLIESLISLSLFLIMIIASLECFISAKEHFSTLKEKQEKDIAAFAALDKMRIDIQDSGRGLVIAHRMGIIPCIELENDALTIRNKEKNLSLIDNLASGSTRISLQSTSNVKKGQELTIYDEKKGETNTIISVDTKSIILASPLIFSYSQLSAEILLLKKVSVYMDRKTGIIRRKVNASSAQPLLEEAVSIMFTYNKTSNLVNINLKTSKEVIYEISVFPKNMGLASPGKTE